MDLWEEVVQNYLAIDRAVFLHPQYVVGDNKWKAEPDFLAIDFFNRRVSMVEVTVSSGNNVVGKLRQFDSEYVPRIKEQLLAHKVITGSVEDWSIGVWVFGRRSYASMMKGWDPPKYQFTALEDIVFPDWNSRFR